MVSQKIKAIASLRSTTSSKGFTLVELIVVITILAILGTIGFLSLQGYSANARDSKRSSDIMNLSKSVLTKNTEGIPYASFVVTGANQRLTTLSIGGATAGATEYFAGTPNFVALNADSAVFSDGSNQYSIATTIKAGGAFQIAASAEKKGATKTALVQGNYSSRTAADATITGSTELNKNTFKLASDSDVGKLRVGDTLAASSPAGIPVNAVISAISADGKTLTLSGGTATATNANATITLLASETTGLIASTAKADGSTQTLNSVIVTNGGTDLPY